MEKSLHASTPVPPPHMEGITSRHLGPLDERKRTVEKEREKEGGREKRDAFGALIH